MKKDGFFEILKAKYNSRQNKREENEDHNTAESSAILRALNYLEKDNKISSKDWMAQIFLGRGYKLLLNFPNLGKAIANYVNPGSYYFVNVRTRYIDNALKDALERGIDQVVILGAGSDSRAYRFTECLQNIHVFELDHQATQKKKTEYLQKHQIDFNHVTFVPIDFNTQSIEIELKRNGFKKGLRNFFVLEGVSFYLTEQAMAGVLNFISTYSDKGSELVFDFVHQSFVKQNFKSSRAQKSYDFHRKLGEPFVFGIKEGTIDEYLAGFGFCSKKPLSPADMESQFLINSNNKLHGQVFDFINLITAVVC